MEKITNSAGRINNSQPIETTDNTSNGHSFDKALKAISKPILREGSIKQFDVEINETTIRAHKTITSAFRKMYSRVANEGVNKGHRFHSELNGRTLEEFKKQNIKEVRSLFSSPYDEPTKTEKAFITNFLEKKFDLTHFSNRAFSPGETLLSRKTLQRNSTEFQESNTTSMDIESYNTTDFIFFAVEFRSGDTSPNFKTNSVFGTEKLTLKIEHYAESIQHGSVALVDYAKSRTDIVNTMMKKTVVQENHTHLLKHSDYIDILSAIQEYNFPRLELTYNIGDFHRALAYHIVEDSRRLISTNNQKYIHYANTILSARSDNHLNEIVSNLYRPQVMVPRILGVKHTPPA